MASPDLPPCGQTKQVGLSLMACARPEHHGNAKSAASVEEHRRRLGQVVNADRHVFVRVSRRGV